MAYSIVVRGPLTDDNVVCPSGNIRHGDLGLSNGIVEVGGKG